MDLLIVIAGLWLLAASVTDLKKREVSDWLSFSLIAIALSFRLSESIISGSYSPILASIGGLLIFFIISNIMYLGKLFAGGDVKLMTALGAVIPSVAFISNVLVAGSIYGIAFSIILALMNSKKFSREFLKHKAHLMISSGVFIIFLLGYVFTSSLIIAFVGIFILLITVLFVFVNSVEKSCLIKKVDPKDLTVGDWLLKDAKIGRNVIKANFEGLTRSEINALRKHKEKVYVKYGIPFVPVFLLAFILTVFFGNIFLTFI